jgi:hypothetical protein
MTSQRLPPKRPEMCDQSAAEIERAIRDGYADIKAGRYFKSSGNFLDDRKIFAKKEREGWQ